MNNLQRAKLDSYRREMSFDNEYATELNTVVDYKQLEQEFDAGAAAIEDAAALQEQDNGVTPELLEERKRVMAETVHLFAIRGSVKASIVGNPELANQLNKSVSYISRAPKEIAVQRAQNLAQLMEANLATLTTLSSDDITAMNDAIARYTSVMDKPVIDLQHRKSLGTDPLPALFDRNDLLREQKFKLVKSYFFTSKLTMVEEMDLAQQIINTGLRHTSVEFTILDSSNKKPLEGVTVIDTSNDKHYISDADGDVFIEKHKNGDIEFIFIAPGQSAVNKTFPIIQGIDNAFSVEL